jgi:hypothetical protein
MLALIAVLRDVLLALSAAVWLAVAWLKFPDHFHRPLTGEEFLKTVREYDGR